MVASLPQTNSLRYMGTEAKNIFSNAASLRASLLKSGRNGVKKTENVTVKVTKFVAE
jgi:hypothetical protein